MPSTGAISEYDLRINALEDANVKIRFATRAADLMGALSTSKSQSLTSVLGGRLAAKLTSSTA